MHQLDRLGKSRQQPRAKRELAAQVKKLCSTQAPHLTAVLCLPEIPVPFALTDQKHWRGTMSWIAMTFVVSSRHTFQNKSLIGVCLAVAYAVCYSMIWAFSNVWAAKLSLRCC